MTLVRDEILHKIWRDVDPYANTPKLPPDIQGWNSTHRYLTDAIDHRRPDIVIEVGVWKGASVLTMARRMRDIGCDGVVIAVDTWRGSAEHWLGFDPTRALYETFRSNVVNEELSGHIVPLPLDSASACEVLSRLEIPPSVLHIDAAHDYRSVMNDLTRWWALLDAGGELIADDYGSPMWPQVTRAVDDFRTRMPHKDFEATDTKCRFVKQ